MASSNCPTYFKMLSWALCQAMNMKLFVNYMIYKWEKMNFGAIINIYLYDFILMSLWVLTSSIVYIYFFFIVFIFLFLLFYFILFNFTILYWFYHISKWICHRYTCVPHPEPSALLPPHAIPLGRPSAPAPSIQYRASNLDWRLVSYMILHIFQCHSPKSSIASWPAYRFLRRQVRWSGIPISWRIFHSLLWSTQSKALA